MAKIAFVFPGQGSQSVGMGKDLAENFDIGKKLFAQANEVLGLDLKKLCFEGPEEKLKQTPITQPALFTVSAIAYEVLKEKGLQPDIVAGHSLGEYSALYAAGAITFADGVKTVHQRGKFMEEAVPSGVGAMSAVMGLESNVVKEILQEVEKVDAANFNGGGQIVISGEAKGVEKAGALLKEAGAKRVIPLPVSGPFHSRLMQPAADKLKAELDKIIIKDASIPIITNVTAQKTTATNEIKNLLIQQLFSPVLWEGSIKNIISEGITTFVEVGSGKVLSGLIKKIDRNTTTLNVANTESLNKTLEQLKGGT